jgi:hypothetical protein
MPRRSVRVTLSNNTPFTLKLIDPRIATEDPCHGNWTDVSWRPPQQIAQKSHGAWQSESAGIGTGTEGWVKYQIENTDADLKADPTGRTLCLQELVYIHWDNPFIWDPLGHTKPIDFTVSTTDVTPPCNSDGSGRAADPHSDRFCNNGRRVTKLKHVLCLYIPSSWKNFILTTRDHATRTRMR